MRRLPYISSMGTKRKLLSLGQLYAKLFWLDSPTIIGHLGGIEDKHAIVFKKLQSRLLQAQVLPQESQVPSWLPPGQEFFYSREGVVKNPTDGKALEDKALETRLKNITGSYFSPYLPEAIDELFDYSKAHLKKNEIADAVKKAFHETEIKLSEQIKNAIVSTITENYDTLHNFQGYTFCESFFEDHPMFDEKDKETFNPPLELTKKIKKNLIRKQHQKKEEASKEKAPQKQNNKNVSIDTKSDAIVATPPKLPRFFSTAGIADFAIRYVNSTQVSLPINQDNNIDIKKTRLPIKDNKESQEEYRKKFPISAIRCLMLFENNEPSNKQEVVCSISKEIIDNWSIPNVGIQTSGGGPQIFYGPARGDAHLSVPSQEHLLPLTLPATSSYRLQKLTQATKNDCMKEMENFLNTLNTLSGDQKQIFNHIITHFKLAEPQSNEESLLATYYAFKTGALENLLLTLNNDNTQDNQKIVEPLKKLEERLNNYVELRHMFTGNRDNDNKKYVNSNARQLQNPDVLLEQIEEHGFTDDIHEAMKNYCSSPENAIDKDSYLPIHMNLTLSYLQRQDYDAALITCENLSTSPLFKSKLESKENALSKQLLSHYKITIKIKKFISLVGSSDSKQTNNLQKEITQASAEFDTQYLDQLLIENQDKIDILEQFGYFYLSTNNFLQAKEFFTRCLHYLDCSGSGDEVINLHREMVKILLKYCYLKSIYFADMDNMTAVEWSNPSHSDKENIGTAANDAKNDAKFTTIFKRPSSQVDSKEDLISPTNTLSNGAININPLLALLEIITSVESLTQKANVPIAQYFVKNLQTVCETDQLYMENARRFSIFLDKLYKRDPSLRDLMTKKSSNQKEPTVKDLSERLIEYLKSNNDRLIDIINQPITKENATCPLTQQQLSYTLLQLYYLGFKVNTAQLEAHMQQSGSCDFYGLNSASDSVFHACMNVISYIPLKTISLEKAIKGFRDEEKNDDGRNIQAGRFKALLNALNTSRKTLKKLILTGSEIHTHYPNEFQAATALAEFIKNAPALEQVSIEPYRLDEKGAGAQAIADAIQHAAEKHKLTTIGLSNFKHCGSATVFATMISQCSKITTIETIVRNSYSPELIDMLAEIASSRGLIIKIDEKESRIIGDATIGNPCTLQFTETDLIPRKEATLKKDLVTKIYATYQQKKCSSPSLTG